MASAASRSTSPKPKDAAPPRPGALDHLVLNATANESAGQVSPGERPLLEVSGLSKFFAGQAALRDFDFTVEEGEVHALLGENGSGKSTFIKLLSGYHLPDGEGTMCLDGAPLLPGDPSAAHRAGARFVHQDLGLVAALSIADNMFVGGGFPRRFGGIDTAKLRQATRAQLEIVGLDLDPFAYVEKLSPSMKTGVAVARALLSSDGSPVRLLVLDEPTATLPEDEVRQLHDIISAVTRRGVGVVYVTHRLDEVFEIANRVTVLRDGVKVANAHVADLSRPQLIEMLVGAQMAAKVSEVYSEVDLPAQETTDPTPQAASPILEVRGLRTDRIEGVSFAVGAGEIVGFAGITGSGRETLLGAAFGGFDRTGGQVAVLGSVIPPGDTSCSVERGIAYLPGERKLHGGMMEMTARENFSLPSTKSFLRRTGLSIRAERAETRRWFEEMAVNPPDAIERPLGLFSGGNQQKILLAKWLRTKPKVLLLDEPTQGVDIGARSQIHQRLGLVAAEGAAVVVASSDAEELAAICHVVYVLRKGQIMATLRGAELTEHTISVHSLGSGEVAA